MDNDEVARDPIYFQTLQNLLTEANRKFTGFENMQNVLVLDVTDSKMHLEDLYTLALREWNLDDLVPTIAPSLKEIHLCEGTWVRSGAGGRLLRHKCRDDVPHEWKHLWSRQVSKRAKTT